jgi:hypothetical protein
LYSLTILFLAEFGFNRAKIFVSASNVCIDRTWVFAFWNGDQWTQESNVRRASRLTIDCSSQQVSFAKLMFVYYIQFFSINVWPDILIQSSPDLRTVWGPEKSVLKSGGS